MFRRPKLKALVNWIENTLREAAWAPLLVLGVHVALHVSNIYQRFPYLDLPMHFFGGVVMAFFFHRVSINASLLGITRPYHALRHRLFVFTSTCMAAVSWEFSEFVTGWYSAGQTREGLNDTIGDLFLGIIGCLFFIISASRSRPTYLIYRSR
jgi:hypothetical protein